MTKTYDTILLPTGEKMSGENAFPVSQEAIKLFDSGKFGNIFVTGGYGGFSKIVPGKSKTEAEETFEYLIEKGIPENKIYYDSQSLETLGNFTFPLVQPMNKNPNLSEFNKLLVIGQEGHMWRIKDYAHLVLSPKKEINFHAIPGRHNDGLMAKVYHAGFMNALKDSFGAEEAHDFLINNHPFYSKDWYKKSVPIRKIETTLKGLSWYLK